MNEDLLYQAIIRARDKGKIFPALIGERKVSFWETKGPKCSAGEARAVGIDFKESLEDSRSSSILLRTLNLVSNEETWNLTVRSERFSWEAISLLARLFKTPSKTSSSRRVSLTELFAL